jgi:hypothetical protein
MYPESDSVEGSDSYVKEDGQIRIGVRSTLDQPEKIQLGQSMAK